MNRQGPLAGIKVVELAGIGPAPMGAMLLADLGAEVITVDRMTPRSGGIPRPPAYDICRRNRRSIALNLKTEEGVACAILEASRSGKGQVVDAAMVDGAATLMSSLYGLYAAGLHRAERGSNLLDGGAPHYNVYACADGEWVSVAPLEVPFRKILLSKMGFDPDTFPDVEDQSRWPEANALLATRFAERTRDEWCDVLEGTDACFAPVLNLDEAPLHSQNSSRGTFVEVDGVMQPAPSPRFSRTPAATPKATEAPGSSSSATLAEWGFSTERIAALEAAGIIPAPADQSLIGR